jgi:ElaB/YqjD/DUF883 family membrane-anchored ribosome-binding protein
MNTVTKPLDQPNSLADQVAQSADDIIKSTQRVTNEALDGLAANVQDMRQMATPVLNRAAEQASALAQRGVDAVRDSSQQLRDRGQRASDGAVNYIQNKPIQAMLLAAGCGAALMALLTRMNGPRDRD